MSGYGSGYGAGYGSSGGSTGGSTTTSAAATKQTAQGQTQAQAPPTGTEETGKNSPIALHMLASETLLIVYAGVIGLFIIYNIATRVQRYIRRMATMNRDSQRYFSQPNLLTLAKRLVIYAPLGRSRHHNELMAGKLHLGTIPSRLESFLLAALLGINIYLLVRNLQIPVTIQNLSLLYNRASTLAVTNLIPLVFFAGRWQPFIKLTGVDFNNFNTLHRWIGRLVVALIVIHATCNIINFGARGGTAGIAQTFAKVQYIRNGLVAAICLVLILFQSGPEIRKPFYETFLVTHQLLVAVFLAYALLHTAQFPQGRLVQFAALVWISERVIRLVNLLRNNLGRRGTKILAEVLPGDAMRITVYIARPFKIVPGQHLYMYLPSVGLWTNHPFSIAWSDKEQVFKEPDAYEIEKGGLVGTSQSVSEESSMSLIVRRRNGMTSTLYNKAVKAGGRLSCRAFIEGPYGGLHGLDSYGTVLLFSGGVGITHHVPYIRRLVAGFSKGTVSCRKLVMVWAVQSSEHLEWVRPWMTTILGMEGRRDLLRIMIFVTRPDPNHPSALDVQSPSASVKMFPGRRPDVASIIDAEAADQVGTMAISVCGSGPLSDAVRAETRRKQKTNMIDFYDESFSW